MEEANKIMDIPTMDFGTLYRFLTTKLGCFECKYAEFIFTTSGLSFKCKEALKYRQSLCWEYGNPTIIDETKLNNKGLYNCECDWCGTKFEAYSVVKICQDCYIQAEYENRGEIDE